MKEISTVSSIETGAELRQELARILFEKMLILGKLCHKKKKNTLAETLSRGRNEAWKSKEGISDQYLTDAAGIGNRRSVGVRAERK